MQPCIMQLLTSVQTFVFCFFQISTFHSKQTQSNVMAGLVKISEKYLGCAPRNPTLYHFIGLLYISHPLNDILKSQ